MSELTRFSPKQTMDSTTFQITHSKDTYLPYLELHHHDFYEIYFFISGSVSMSIEGKHYRLLPGDMILINTLELHQALIHDPAIPYERIVLWINKSFLKSLSTPLTNLESCFSTYTSSNNLLRCTESIIDAIHITLKKILEAKKATSFGSDILYHTYLTELLVLINRAFENTQASCIYQHHYSELVSNCIEYIHDHIEEELSLDTLAQNAVVGEHDCLIAQASHSSPVSPPPFMVGFAEVEVDTETGHTEMIDYVGVVDCGTVINTSLARIQAEGGIAQGIGMALYEDITYTAEGKMRNNTFMQHNIPTRLDVGNIRVAFESTYEPTGPFGAKSIGEVVINTPCPAIAHAIYNATGVRVRELPITPEKIILGGE